MFFEGEVVEVVKPYNKIEDKGKIGSIVTIKPDEDPEKCLYLVDFNKGNGIYLAEELKLADRKSVICYFHERLSMLQLIVDLIIYKEEI